MLAAIAAAAVALAIVRTLFTESDPPVVEPAAERPPAPAPIPPAPPATVPAASGPAAVHRIDEGGRLLLDAAQLPRAGERLALDLPLPDEARGDGTRPARIVAVDGTSIETQATALPGSGSGMRLELDPQWLLPGRYLIEVRTAEVSPLPLRRYVLEVR